MRQHSQLFVSATLLLGVSAITVFTAQQKIVREWDTDYRRSLKGHRNEQALQALNVLALGGSITWGAELLNRTEEAYPYVIGAMYNEYMDGKLDVSVDNLAIRATGADYPSMCLQTLVADATPQDPDKSYDLILLDFTLNGLDGYTALLHRLRQRYPDAEIVVVELWSLKSSIEEVGTKLTVSQAGPNSDLEWTWVEDLHSRKEKQGIKIQMMEDMIEGFSARHIALPLPPSPRQAIEQNWFSRDWHHPSAFGHRLLAKTIFDVLIQHSNVSLVSRKSIGGWGLGDQCYNWFLSGNVPLSYEGAMLAGVKTSDGMTKSFLEIGDKGGSIEFVSRFDHPVLLSLGYMSRQIPAQYPRVRVFVENDETRDVNDSVKQSGIYPDRNHIQDPTAHIAAYSSIGYAAPGKNVIRILPKEHTSQPFRVIGIILCGVCSPRHEAVAVKAQEQSFRL